MPVPGFLAGAPQRYGVQYGYVVFDDRRLPGDEAGGVIEHDAGPETGRGVDVYTEGDADLVLEELRQGLAALAPEPVGDAERLQGVEALVE